MPKITFVGSAIPVMARNIHVGHLLQGEDGGIWIRTAYQIIDTRNWQSLETDESTSLYIDLGPLEVVEE